jgi:CheY-like chemotaxis protein
MWASWKPHLIWMDVRMPVVDGHELVQRIKATTQGQSTVVVALTAAAFEEDRAKLLSEGCDDYVRKPFRENEIVDVLARNLGLRFMYEGAAKEDDGAEEVLSCATLASLPAGWVTAMRQATLQADADLVLGLIDQICEQNVSLANALTRLVHDFRFDSILAWVALSREDAD